MDYTIYLIENVNTPKLYVGLTSQSIDERWSGHRAHARAGLDCPLHKSIRHHGPEAFRIAALTWASSQAKAEELEKEWIERLGTYKYGYNATPGGEIFHYNDLPEGEDNIQVTVSDERALELMHKYACTPYTVKEIVDGAEVSTAVLHDWLNGKNRTYLVKKFEEKFGFDVTDSSNRMRGTSKFSVSHDHAVKKIREYATSDKSQSEIAAEIGINSSNFGRWVTGRRRPYLQELYQRRYGETVEESRH